MDKKSAINAINEAKEKSKDRNFSQTVELIINLRGLNLKNADNQMNFFVNVKHPWKEQKICGLVGAELLDQSKKSFNHTISSEDLDKFKDKKKEIKKLARQYDYFVAQANLMPQVATIFGRSFGPLGKMPNPKAGCVVPPNANLEPLKKKLNTTVNINIKSAPLFQVGIGKVDGKPEEMAEDAVTIYDQIVHHLPAEKQNIKSVYIKLTMGTPVRVE